MNDLSQTYWNSNGKHQDLADALRTRIPDSGEVRDVEYNPKLEKYRLMMNCYHDLYNNGLCNRRAEFTKHFKMPKYAAEADAKAVDACMDKAIMDAALEQLTVAP